MSDARTFSTAASRWEKFLHLCGYSMATIVDTAERISKSDHRSDEEILHHLEQMKKHVKSVQQVQAEAKERMNGYKEIEEVLNSGGNGEVSTDQLAEMYEDSATNAQKVADEAGRTEGPEAKKILDLMKKIARADRDDEMEDIEITENRSETLRRCPILNCELNNPVKNNVCGHVYSLKGAIQLLFQINASSQAQVPNSLERVPPNYSAPCPVAMCVQRLSPGQLRRDYATELTQRQMQSASANRRDSMDVEELV